MDTDISQHDHERLQQLAQRMARACRHVIEDVLYEWEVNDAEEEFFELILAGLQELYGSTSESGCRGNGS